ncbi:MAG TPA: hypothetical protein VGS99_07705 [Gammaproteobacteria bacterium]|nr:hypothetical protein [Gammaproteobacteria bacterium]
MTLSRGFAAGTLLLATLPACSADKQDFTPLATLHMGTATLQVDRAPGKLTATDADVLDWIKTGAKAVNHYYGRFPVNKLRILVKPSHHTTGTTYGDEDGAFIRLGVGADDTAAELGQSWVITHEMVHTAFPQMPDAQHWIEEGIATYVEPVARAQVGDLSVAYLWQETVEGMPKGLPEPGDQGLDHTHTWGRTYWGGALFCLLADVRIREQTKNRYGLQDALRGILAAGGNIQTEGSIEQALAAADKAVGVTVLEDLYQQMKDKPVDVDLNALWKRLGVVYRDGQISFDDQAPEAAIRKAITAADTR